MDSCGGGPKMGSPTQQALISCPVLCTISRRPRVGGPGPVRREAAGPRAPGEASKTPSLWADLCRPRLPSGGEAPAAKEPGASGTSREPQAGEVPVCTPPAASPARTRSAAASASSRSWAWPSRSMRSRSSRSSASAPPRAASPGGAAWPWPRHWTMCSILPIRRATSCRHLQMSCCTKTECTLCWEPQSRIHASKNSWKVVVPSSSRSMMVYKVDGGILKLIPNADMISWVSVFFSSPRISALFTALSKFKSMLLNSVCRVDRN
mmetsp:Transcript_102481/g.298938  ORF Transcript_102481/g.298938 Transcript_102481/m.298938 type:complete len:265 (-) Transcript_102481:926-1720(-)